MIKIENTEVVGWEHAIRGMRNPLNSWKKSDSGWYCSDDDDCDSKCDGCEMKEDNFCAGKGSYKLGPNDLELAKRLCNAGTPDHRKFMRMLIVYVDVTAPLYFWKEHDQYKVGTTTNGCSTMHKIHEKGFTINDFSYEHLMHDAVVTLSHTIDNLNQSRRVYLYGGELCDAHGNWTHFEPKDKNVWWQLIQILPSSYNQKRTVMLNYEVLANMYKSRKNHKLDEWCDFCEWIKTLPYSELITGDFKEDTNNDN